MADLKKFGKQRLAYLRTRHPKVLELLKEEGILEIHLLYAQKRADRQMDRLVLAGMEEFEAEKVVLRRIIQV
jgi:hypothetical protein